jgi:hypothetical protein
MLLGLLQLVVFLNVFQDEFKRDSYTICKSVTKKNTEMSIDATREFRLETDAEKTKNTHMLLSSPPECSSKSWHKNANRSLENAAQYKYSASH